jgi:MFS family permease
MSPIHKTNDDTPTVAENPHAPDESPIHNAPKNPKGFRVLLAVLATLGFLAILGNVAMPLGLKRLFDRSPPKFVVVGNTIVVMAAPLYECMSAVALGVFLSQLAAIATGMAIIPWPIAYRALAGCVASLFGALSLFIGVQYMEASPPPIAIFVVMTCGAIVTCGSTAWLLACLLRWRKATIVLGNAFPSVQKRIARKQFDVRFLLALMVATAVSIQVVRTTVPSSNEDWLAAEEFILIGLWFVWLISGLSILLWLLCLLFLQPQRSKWSIAAIAACIGLGPLIFQTVSANVIFGMLAVTQRVTLDFSYEFIRFGYLMTLGLVAAMMIVLQIARWLGVRLEPRLEPIPHAAPADPMQPAPESTQPTDDDVTSSLP